MIDALAAALGLLIALALIAIAGIAILNALTFPRLKPSPGPPDDRLVTIAIPARNEAEVIAGTVSGLLAQSGVRFELLVLDDQSTDGTADLARAAAADDPRLQVICGAPLPEKDGWFGKNWACWQLAQAAKGDVLLFTDADVRWSDGALEALVRQQARSKAGLVTVWPTQQTVTWSERLIVPLMALVIQGYLPSPLANHTPWTPFAAANGQCLLFTREAYMACGGHSAVRGSIVEDIDLARRIKRAGRRLYMTDGNGQVLCRMYRSWPQVRDGYAKNIIAGYGDTGRMLLGVVFHWLIFLLPWLWLIGAALSPAGPGKTRAIALPLGLVSIGLLVRALTAAATRQRVADALLMPVSAMLMTVISARALYWQLRYGGPRWKGRTLINVRR